MSLQEVIEVPKLPARRIDSHKGDFGRVLVIGGSRGMIGARALAANSALRGGAGLVTMALPECIQPFAATLAWCATSLPLPWGGQEGHIVKEALPVLIDEIVRQKKYEIVAIGPGLGPAECINDLVPGLVEADIPLVLDADALNNLARIDWTGMLAGKCVITPHPGEMARLIGRPIKQIQADRTAAALQAVKTMNGGRDANQAVCVLKGHRTVVTDGKRLYVNRTGNPGMASGGSGDVLTGLTAALLGQQLETFDAAVLAVYLHGLAADLAANDLSQPAMIAQDILTYLPQAFTQHLANS